MERVHIDDVLQSLRVVIDRRLWQSGTHNIGMLSFLVTQGWPRFGLWPLGLQQSFWNKH